MTFQLMKASPPRRIRSSSPAITRKLLLICFSPSAAHPGVKNLFLLYCTFRQSTRLLILPSPNQNRPPCQRIQPAPQHEQHRLRL